MVDQDQAVESPDQAPVQSDEHRQRQFEQGMSAMLHARQEGRRAAYQAAHGN